ncbi:unnamed protein product [Bursaphelenchus okinawaensis]|uniref:Uncharacterized protein n=1 Tax=Bursaphelenchus okinawaensis TaxID=465554 RepID=A0A811JRL5_9BILA|nr:unnamed protein product [Bursaphelenchus okinawaensis]CAG9080057.1 unnamed protein product [Bursaphelenchus okinawaensis]
MEKDDRTSKAALKFTYRFSRPLAVLISQASYYGVIGYRGTTVPLPAVQRAMKTDRPVTLVDVTQPHSPVGTSFTNHAQIEAMTNVLWTLCTEVKDLAKSQAHFAAG